MTTLATEGQGSLSMTRDSLPVLKSGSQDRHGILTSSLRVTSVKEDTTTVPLLFRGLFREGCRCRCFCNRGR